MIDDLSNYEIVNPALWTGRADSLANERFFQHVECIDVRTHSLQNSHQPIFLGFRCDEGVRRNAGRTGAKEGPDHLRKQLAKLACHTEQRFLDIGNIVCDDLSLEEAQAQFAELISYCHKNSLQTIALGGGHEIAWAHFSGLAPHYPKIGIINFDAHFDIRSIADGQHGTSGTPFWQIKHYCQQHQRSFDYCCMGIQPTANTKSLFDRAQEWGIDYLTAEQMHHESISKQKDFLDKFMQKFDYLYLSICLDVFSESYAPGVSAPQATGLNPWQTLPLLKYVVQTGKVVSIDVAELSPPLDHEHKTSRLAAVILAELLNLKE